MAWNLRDWYHLCGPLVQDLQLGRINQNLSHPYNPTQHPWGHWINTDSINLFPPQFSQKKNKKKPKNKKQQQQKKTHTLSSPWQGLDRGSSHAYPSHLPKPHQNAALPFFLFFFSVVNLYLIFYWKDRKTKQASGMPALPLPSLSSAWKASRT